MSEIEKEMSEAVQEVENETSETVQEKETELLETVQETEVKTSEGLQRETEKQDANQEVERQVQNTVQEEEVKASEIIQDAKQEPLKTVQENEDGSIIALKNISIRQHGTYILKDVNLNINKGEFVYLIGKSGTGKTSLLRSLYADFPIEIGEGMVCDISLNKIKRRKISLLRRKIGIVFQNFQLLTDRNVYNNLSFVLMSTGWKDKVAIEERIVTTLESVNLSDKVLKPIYQLSEGEQQRVGIARALINDPELILADEPTGNLDPATSEEIIGLLKSINEKKKTTILIATHDYITLDKFRSRIISFENGTIIHPAEPIEFAQI